MKKDKDVYGEDFGKQQKLIKITKLILNHLKIKAEESNINESCFVEIALEKEFKNLNPKYKTVKELKLEIANKILDKGNK